MGGATPLIGGATPAYAGAFGTGSRTPMYGGGMGGQTPMYGGGPAGGATPMYGVAGGHTPGYGGYGAIGNQTPFVGGAGSQTPYGMYAGGATPTHLTSATSGTADGASTGLGGATPTYNTAAGRMTPGGMYGAGYPTSTAAAATAAPAAAAAATAAAPAAHSWLERGVCVVIQAPFPSAGETGVVAHLPTGPTGGYGVLLADKRIATVPAAGLVAATDFAAGDTARIIVGDHAGRLVTVSTVDADEREVIVLLGDEDSNVEILPFAAVVRIKK